ncbi:MAG: trypsin-like peptidase domain-containing protein [Deltaproteobacteria bacterium]|nr:trypsin-like peptidase domain-containing protein [Deltaproteobacteria bacterium]
MERILRALGVVTFVTFVIPTAAAMAEVVVSSNALQRTFQLKYGNQTGTCFTLDVDGRQYLITAKHVVDGLKGGGDIEIRRDSQWQSLPVKAFFPSPNSVDIAVLAAPLQISPSLPLPAEPVNLFVSQDVYFLGFPYGLSMDAKNLNAGFPLPFVKRGIVAAFVAVDGGAQIIVVDGLNNSGFSGGPVVYQDVSTRELKVAGVVSSYRFQEDKVFEGGKETTFSVRSNTGLLIAYGIKKALEVIRANPVGAVIELGK